MSRDAVRPAKGAPFLRRLLCSPFRDLLRGRVSGRLDLRWLGASSGLPGTCAKLAVEVARRTRLRGLEKSDVVRELLAHFRDGLASGATEDTLLRAFGDARLAAKLIRKAKRRNRSLASKLTTRAATALGAALGLLVIAYPILTIIALQGEPNPSHDYLADLNAEAFGDRTEDNAWPLYREAALQVRDRDALMPTLDRALSPSAGPDGRRAGYEAAVAHVGALALAREGAARARLGFAWASVLDPSDRALFGDANRYRDEPAPPPRGIPTLDAVAPHLGPMRDLARLLAMDALRAGAAGDGAAVVADLRALVAMQSHVRAQPALIADLVSISIGALAANTAREVLRAYSASLTDEQLVAIANLFASLEDRILNVRLAGERMMMADVIQHVYTDDGKGSGRVVPGMLRKMDRMRGVSEESISRYDIAYDAMAGVEAFVFPRRREMEREADRLYALAEVRGSTPLWLRGRDGMDAELDAIHRGRARGLRWVLLGTLLPALDLAMANAEIACMQRDGVLIACAFELFHRRHGRWPDSLDELTPDLLPSVPIDRFNGEPLRYRVDASLGPVVYSVGADLDDDGGVPPGFDGQHAFNGWAMRWYPREDVERIKASPEWKSATNRLFDEHGRPMRRPELADGDWILFPPIPEPPREDSEAD